MSVDPIYSIIPLFFLCLLCFWVSSSRWKIRLSCKEEIQGVFLYCHVLGFGKNLYTSAKSEYTYNGQKLK